MLNKSRMSLLKKNIIKSTKVMWLYFQQVKEENKKKILR